MRLVPLGDMLIAYFRDCIFVGRRTNYPNAPVAFFQAESLGLGLTGMKAILPFYGSHIIITKLGPYIFDGSNLQPLPCTILQDFIRDNIKPEYNRIVFDEERGLILFCLADKDKQIYKEYVYDVIGKVWSIFDIPTQMVDSPNVTTYTTIDGLSPQEINDLNQEIDSYGSYQDKKTLFWTYTNRMFRTSTSAILFFEQIPVTVEIVTQDFDFDVPDNIKSFHRLGIKIDYRVPPVDQITFQVQGSVNRGRVWKTLGTLVINVGEDEGYVNFRLTGSTARFRLLSASVVSPYNITEITIKTRVSGSDESLNSQQH